MAPFAAWPVYAAEEIEAVTRVIRSGKVDSWTCQEVWRFEEEYAAAAGCNYSVALANGTNALELAFQATDFRPRTTLDIAKQLGYTSFMFPIHPGIRSQNNQAVLSVTRDVIAKATGLSSAQSRNLHAVETPSRTSRFPNQQTGQAYEITNPDE